METKVCKKCKEEKILDDFYERAGAKDGHRNECKQCRRKMTAKWVDENPDAHAANTLRWRTLNPEKHRASVRKANAKWVKEHSAKADARTVRQTQHLRQPEVNMETKVCSKCEEEKNVEDFSLVSPNKNNKRRSYCKACAASLSRLRRKLHPEKQKAADTKWIANNREKRREVTANWRAKTVEHRRAYNMEIYAKDPQKGIAKVATWKKSHPEQAHAQTSRYQKAHPAAFNKQNARHRAEKLKATPAWANQKLIQFKYDLAARMTKATGYQWDVDHIIPLRNKLVCGLHVENNLQVITHVANMKKGNRIQL